MFANHHVLSVQNIEILTQATLQQQIRCKNENKKKMIIGNWNCVIYKNKICEFFL
jgi:hypothetical protein